MSRPVAAVLDFHRMCNVQRIGHSSKQQHNAE